MAGLGRPLSLRLPFSVLEHRNERRRVGRVANCGELCMVGRLADVSRQDRIEFGEANCVLTSKAVILSGLLRLGDAPFLNSKLTTFMEPCSAASMSKVLCWNSVSSVQKTKQRQRRGEHTCV